MPKPKDVKRVEAILRTVEFWEKKGKEIPKHVRTHIFQTYVRISASMKSEVDSLIRSI